MKSSRRLSSELLVTLALLVLVRVQSFQIPYSRTTKLFPLRTSHENDGWDDQNPAPTNHDAENMDLLKSLQEKSVATSPPAKERDMFIPIFTLVAIAGFTGAYGYEMLRLYSRGELYFPF